MTVRVTATESACFCHCQAEVVLLSLTTLQETIPSEKILCYQKQKISFKETSLCEIS